MRWIRGLSIVASTCLLLFAGAPLAQQKLGLANVVEMLDRDGHVTVDNGNVVVLTFDFVVGGDTVEAVAVRPAAEARYPALLLIPGFSKSARGCIPLAVQFAKDGFACVAVAQPGFGRSTGPPDFVGPRTIVAVETAFRRFQRESYVDSSRMGVFGYSRGAMAAALLAVRLKGTELKGAVFAAGIYDFKKAYDEVKLPGIRENMEREAGLSETAVQERTSVTKMDALACPVLIFHGEKDENAPVSQAYLLRDRLTQLKKEFELKTFPDRGHDIGVQNFLDETLFFFKRSLVSDPPKQ